MRKSDQSMLGKVCIVTGATSGLGAVTANALAQLGASVIVVGRNPQKCTSTVNQIKQQTGNHAVEWMRADLSSQQEIRKLAQQFKNRYQRLDVLINNAAVLLYKRQESVDGIEMTFAVNHLSYFLLTNLLLDTLIASAPARIINVSSSTHAVAEIDFSDLQYRRWYRPFKAYAKSKLANLLFTYELARRIDGTGVTVNAVHPGLVSTNLGEGNGLTGRLVKRFLHLCYRGSYVTPEDGAKSILFLATSPEGAEVSGKYFVEGLAVLSSERSYNAAAARRLWDCSIELTKLVTPELI